MHVVPPRVAIGSQVSAQASVIAAAATVAHAYKWLCAPRGASLMTLSERFQAELRPVQAGWYAGTDVWASCYGARLELADELHAALGLAASDSAIVTWADPDGREVKAMTDAGLTVSGRAGNARVADAVRVRTLA